MKKNFEIKNRKFYFEFSLKNVSCLKFFVSTSLRNNLFGNHATFTEFSRKNWAKFRINKNPGIQPIFLPKMSSTLNFNELNNDLGVDDLNLLKAEISDLNNYSDRKSYAKGLVDIALLTANANQLKHAIAIDDLTYKIVNICFVVTSIILQVSSISLNSSKSQKFHL